MKIELKLSDDIEENYVIIYAKTLTPEIQKMMTLLRTDKKFVPVYRDDQIILLQPDEIYMVRVENGKVVIYGKKDQDIVHKRLYEVADDLGKSFIKISKACYINLEKLKLVEPSFNGMMRVELQNGLSDYISRKYLHEFKKYLGI